MVTVNKKYKDGIFRMLFEEKSELLSLYNAVAGTSYTDTDDLEVNTLENVIYMLYKNDISFVIDGRLSLYEHQYTWCGNLPLRYLMYTSNLFSKITAKSNLHGSKTVAIPSPHYVVFYNGVKEMPDRSVHKLSDAYITKEADVDLELKVIVLNINKGHNEELMKNCKMLEEYAYFVQAVREAPESMTIEEKVEWAIDKCIEIAIKPNISDRSLCDLLRYYVAISSIKAKRLMAALQDSDRDTNWV